MKQLITIVLFCFSCHLISQSELDIELNESSKNDVESDTLKKVPWGADYREDQFYFRLTHDLFLNNPKDIQNNLSITLATGFFRDIPLSKNRQMAFAPGIGLAYKRHNTFIYPNEIATIDSKLTINQWLIEVPIEFRWRKSTIENSSFFRCHVGTKLSYRFYGDLNFRNLTDSNLVFSNDINYVNPFFIQNYLVVGYSILNVYVAYSYQPFYKNATFNGQSLNTKSLTLGFIFYVL